MSALGSRRRLHRTASPPEPCPSLHAPSPAGRPGAVSAPGTVSVGHGPAYRGLSRSCSLSKSSSVRPRDACSALRRIRRGLARALLYLALPALSASQAFAQAGVITVSPTALSLIEGNPLKSYTVVLGSDPGAAVAVTATSNDSAAQVSTGGAFGSSVTLNFTHGNTGNWGMPQTVEVRATPNDGDTADESVSISHASAVASDPNNPFHGVAIDSVSVAVTDADGLPVVQFKKSSFSDREGDGTITVTVSKTGSAAAEVSYATRDNTATAPADYTATSGVLTWAAGDTADKTFTVPIVDDALGEGPETFRVGLSAPADSTPPTLLGSPRFAVGTIEDNDTVAKLTVTGFGSTARVQEGQVVTFGATLSTNPRATVQIPFRVKSTSAVGAGEVLIVTPFLFFNVATRTTSLNVRIRADHLAEADETLVVEVHDLPDGITLSSGTSAEDSIVVEDVTNIRLAPPPAGAVTEGNTKTLTVELSENAPAGGVSVPVVLRSDLPATTASAADVMLPTIDVAGGASTGTGTFTAVDDNLHEGTERATLIAGAVNGYTNAQTWHVVDITDNDAAPTMVTLSVAPATVSEGDGSTAVTVTATVGGATRWVEAQTVRVSVAGSGGASVVGFTAVADFNLVIPAGADSGTADFNLVPTDDATKTGDETVTVSGTLSDVTVTGAALALTDDDVAPPTNSAPTFPNTTLIRSVAENAAANTNVGTAIPAATDADSDPLTYSFGGADAGSFTFNTGTRQISTRSGITYDFEAKSTYTVTVTADDSNGGTAVTTVTITLTDVAEPPVAPGTPTVTAAAGSTTSLTVTWTAPANAGRPPITNYDLQYRVGSTGNFTNGPQNVTGTTSTITGLTANTAYEVQVRATNNEGDSPWSASGFGSTSANSAPTFPNATATRSIAENTAANTNVGTAIPAATDADSDSLTYSFGGTDAGSFTFNTGTRQISTRSGITYDFEAKSTYTVTVTADDSNGGTAVTTVTITLTDVAEPPVAPATPTVTAAAGSTTSLTVTWTAPANAGRPNIANYDLRYRVGSTGNFTAGPQNVAGTSTTITGLAMNTAYQVQVRATNAEGDSPWSASGSGSTSADNDPAQDTPVITITAGASPVTEGAAAAFTLRANPAPAADLDVSLIVTDAPGSDFVSGEGGQTLTIAANRVAAVYSVPTDTDSIDERNGPVTVAVNSGAGYRVGNPGSARVTVLDNDLTTALLRVVDPVAEESSSTDTGEFTVQLNRGLLSPEILSVPLRFSGGVLNTDFMLALKGSPNGVRLVDGTVIFTGPGSGATASSANVLLTALDDADLEDEIVTADLGEVSAAGLGGDATGSVGGNGRVTVMDEDGAPGPGLIQSAGRLNLVEGGAAASYTVRLREQPRSDVTVTETSLAPAKAALHTGGGTPGASATLTFSPSNWNQAQTVTVTPRDDADEDDEFFAISHAVTGPGGYQNLDVTRIVVFVEDDEAPTTPPSIPVPPPDTGAPAAASAIGPQRVDAGAALTLDLRTNFTGDNLSLAARPARPAIAGAEVGAGRTLTIRGVRRGVTAVTVTATDRLGRSAAQTFRVTVGGTALLPLLPRAADPVLEGFVRVINHSAEDGVVTFTATDDDGATAGPVTLALQANGAAHFNSRDLEDGNPGKGLSGGVGPGQGHWRLALDSELDFEALAYIRTGDGFLTAMHDTAPVRGGAHHIAFLNPASNAMQVSRLRIVNPGDARVEVIVNGVDDAGIARGAAFSIPPGRAVNLTASDLERGTGMDGALGDGQGKWRLRVTADGPVVVMSLLSSPTGNLTNLSTAPATRSPGEPHVVPLFPSASDPLRRQGFLRVVNRSGRPGTVAVEACDDGGTVCATATLALEAGRTRHFNSDDLELGNPGKGLATGTGPGVGDWRLTLSSDLDIEVLAYVRTEDGFVTSMHDVAPDIPGERHVAFLNPASNLRQVSLLRLANPGGEDARVTVAGTDSGGRVAGTVAVTVPAGTARTLSAADLETGAAGLDGALGDGAGKWRLAVASDRPVIVMSLLSSPTGHLTNLSTAPDRGGPPVGWVSPATPDGQ